MDPPKDDQVYTLPNPGTSSNPPASNSRHIPAEILSKIISYVVADGLVITNGSEYDVNRAAIRSFLKTNKSVKNEMLRQVYSRPLHFYLTNERSCRCPTHSGEFEHDDHFCTILLVRSWHLPLYKWSALAVHFVHITQEDAGATAVQHDLSIFSQDSPSALNIRQKFHAATKIMKHYSRALAKTLYCDDHLDLSCKIKFVFENLPRKSLESADKRMPLWTLATVIA